jgi:tRNA-binding EMAP/Myf-like protein
MTPTQKELLKKINAAANIIAKKSRSDSANYMIMSSENAKLFEKALDPNKEARELRKLRKEKLERIAKNQKTSE